MGGARAADRATLDRLAAAIHHRGPDGTGFHSDGAIGLVCTRLAIIDLVTGDQPLFGPRGAVLVANGEIYNDLELRASLGKGEFRTGSDCESPLQLYRRKGLDFVDDLRGMYGIAIYDPEAGHLVLTRDPFGIKPLYYVEDAAGFAFASEPQALIAAGLAGRAIRPQRRAELLQLKFTTGSETIFADIHRVLPGETLVVKGGRIAERRRRNAIPSGGPVKMGYDEAERQLDGILSESVALHLRSDVPYGLFLSSGIELFCIDRDDDPSFGQPGRRVHGRLPRQQGCGRAGDRRAGRARRGCGASCRGTDRVLFLEPRPARGCGGR